MWTQLTTHLVELTSFALLVMLCVEVLVRTAVMTLRALRDSWRTMGEDTKNGKIPD